MNAVMVMQTAQSNGARPFMASAAALAQPFWYCRVDPVLYEYVIGVPVLPVWNAR